MLVAEAKEKLIRLGTRSEQRSTWKSENFQKHMKEWSIWRLWRLKQMK